MARYDQATRQLFLLARIEASRFDAGPRARRGGKNCRPGSAGVSPADIAVCEIFRQMTPDVTTEK
jgi:hypothetical protein